MENKALNYLFAAEEDYAALQILLNANVKTNTIGYIAEQACEKYLKHLICECAGITAQNRYIIPLKKEKLHSLNALCATLYKDYQVKTDYDFRTQLCAVSYLYSTTRYPNDVDFHKISSDEIEMCKKATDVCRSFVLEHLRTLECEVQKSL